MAELATPINSMAVAEAPPLVPGDAALDRAHLSAMTQRDRQLEREVLTLYRTQAEMLLGRIRAKGAPLSPAAIAALAHTVNGSSRGIGAWQVAAAALAIETAAARGDELAGPIDRLSDAVRTVQREIAAILA